MKLYDSTGIGESACSEPEFVTKEKSNTIISDLIQEVVDRNKAPCDSLIKDVPNLVTIVDGEVGIGKSFTLKQYVQDNPDCKTLIFLERKEGVREYADELGGLPIYSERGRPRIEVQLERAIREEDPVVIMTHAALKNMLETGKHIDVFEGFDLIAVDETFTSLAIYANTYDSLSDLIGTLSLLNVPEAEEMGKVIKTVTDEILNSSCNQVELLNFTNEQKSKARRVIENIREGTNKNTYLSADKIEKVHSFLSNISYDQERIFYLERSANTLHFVSAWSFFPKNRSLIVLADGGSTEGAVLAMQKHSPDVEVKSVKLRHVDWSSHTFHIERGATGKGTINDLSNKDKEKLIETLENFDRGLVLAHKGLVEEISQIESIDKHEFIYWANHKGTNNYSNHKAMYIFSLLWQPAAEYSSRYLSEVNRDEYEPGEYELLDLPMKTMTTEVKQAVGRINRNNEYEHVDIYIRIPSGQRGEILINNLKDEFVGATFAEENWYGLEPGSRERKLDDIVQTVGRVFPATCLGWASPLNHLVGEEYRQTLGGYRARNRKQWARFEKKLLEEHGLECSTFGDCERKCNSGGNRIKPQTWVVYRSN